jgi:hypothetical protein
MVAARQHQQMPAASQAPPSKLQRSQSERIKNRAKALMKRMDIRGNNSSFKGKSSDHHVPTTHLANISLKEQTGVGFVVSPHRSGHQQFMTNEQQSNEFVQPEKLFGKCY